VERYTHVCVFETYYYKGKEMYNNIISNRRAHFSPLSLYVKHYPVNGAHIVPSLYISTDRRSLISKKLRDGENNLVLNYIASTQPRPLA